MQRLLHLLLRIKWFVGAAGLAGGLWLVLLGAGVPAEAAPGLPVAEPAGPAPDAALHGALAFAAQPGDSIAADDSACLLCHTDIEDVVTLPSGESFVVQVDPAGLAASAHGTADPALACTSCHEVNAYQYPHAAVDAADLRGYEIARSATCEQCHVAPHITSHPDATAENPVVCTDCHGAHEVQTAETWRTGAGVNVCVDCHVSVGVERQDAEQLTRMIDRGLFAQQPGNDYCLACHSQAGQTLEFPDGGRIFLTVNETSFHDSVHGENNLEQPLVCADCHEDYAYPHAPVTAATEREYHYEMYTLCAECHVEKYEATLDDSHGRALAEGNEDAAVCTDCHGAHDIPEPGNPPVRISLTCGNCHTDIFDQYVKSVHGEALVGEGNTDVPTCIDCHGVHGIADPTTAQFRNRSPELCATCHADDELMTQYDISTDVFETYVADFHGTTVTLFENQDPSVETNKAVCYDCHGVHDIRRPSDPQAGIKANLLETCRQCHPSASENFPNSWTSHFRPSLENNPSVYLINWFYRLVIPGTVGFFGFLVATDIFRRVRLRLRGGRKETHS